MRKWLPCSFVEPEGVVGGEGAVIGSQFPGSQPGVVTPHTNCAVAGFIAGHLHKWLFFNVLNVIYMIIQSAY